MLVRDHGSSLFFVPAFSPHRRDGGLTPLSCRLPLKGGSDGKSFWGRGEKGLSG